MTLILNTGMRCLVNKKKHTDLTPALVNSGWLKTSSNSLRKQINVLVDSVQKLI